MRVQKKIAMVLTALVLAVTGICGTSVEGYAASTEESMDFSELLTEDALIGRITQQTRGIYLLDGMSSIVDCGGGKIGAGGSTTATRECKVSINCIVERLSGGSWVRVTSWTATETNSLDVMTSKVISVASGYWYRVRSTHYAASDVSDSCTSSLRM